MNMLNHLFEKGTQQDHKAPEKKELPKKLNLKAIAHSKDDFSQFDYRLFVANLDITVSDSQFVQAFEIYPSLDKARIVRDQRGKSKGYGFVSFKDPDDFLKALEEKQSKFLGSKPMKIKRAKNA